MDRDEALMLLRGGSEGIVEWNRRRGEGEAFDDLRGAVLAGVHLSGAVLSGVRCVATVFANVDLSKVEGLESVNHAGPSTVGLDTILRSGGRIPEAFLRGCGLTGWEILTTRLYNPELTPPQFVE